MGFQPNTILRKTADFFRPLPEESPCLGIALGRDGLSAVETLETKGKIRVSSPGTFSIPVPLFTGTPSPEAVPALVSVLTPLLNNGKGAYRTLQVSLPDPAARWEVFELERIPAAGSPTEEFLDWRFKADVPGAASLIFASQSLGEEKGKKLLLGVALDRAWFTVVRRALEEAGGRACVLDTAFRFRFNLFYETFRSRGPGALVSLERDYWALSAWDGQTRPRYLRAKWWKRPYSNPADLPLEETVQETERTIRSYVHSGPDRSVENLFVAAPPAWLDEALRAFRDRTGGLAEGLPLTDLFRWEQQADRELTPSAAATAVRR